MFMFEGPDRRKEEERVRKEGRLPPGQSLTLKFPVLHYGPVPPFNPATWDLRVWGEVEQEVRWTWDEFQKLPTEKVMTVPTSTYQVHAIAVCRNMYNITPELTTIPIKAGG